MSGVGAGDDVLEIHLLAVSGVERTQSLLDVAAQCAKVVDVSAQFAADAFLISVGKLAGLSYRSRESF